MKAISSFGGPYIVLDRRYAHTWSGVFGKRFVSADSPFSNDYEAACEATGGLTTPPNSNSKIVNSDCTALIVTSPAETAVIASSMTKVLIVQAEAADPDWSYDEITENTLKEVDFNFVRKLLVLPEIVDYIIFDSSGDLESIGDNFLSFSLIPGIYSLSEAFYKQDLRAEVNLFLLQRDPNQSDE